MADEQSSHEPFDSALLENQQIVTVSPPDVVQNPGISDDILQQAFEVATEGLNESTIQYEDDNVVEIADNPVQDLGNGNVVTAVGPDGVTYRFVASGEGQDLSTEQLTEAIQHVIAGGSGEIAQISNQEQSVPQQATLFTSDAVGQNLVDAQYVPQQNQQDLSESLAQNISIVPTSSSEQNISIVPTDSSTQSISILPSDSSVQNMSIVPTDSSATISNGSIISMQLTEDGTLVPVDNVTQTTSLAPVKIVSSKVPQGNVASKTVVNQVRPGKNSEPTHPLGSSKNPIRIIQQGSQYRSMQQLTGDQLQQIMQIVQQQRLAQKAQKGGGSSVLFNPETQTRIVYKVLNTSQLHAQSNKVAISSIKNSVNVIDASALKRTYRKRKLLEDDEDKIDIPELTAEEKEQRKKVKPRTRSGRVSKPPKHMVQDYKHLHPVDWDDDPLDDSDGGYSDYKVSSDEGEDDDDNKENEKELQQLDGKYSCLT